MTNQNTQDRYNEEMQRVLLSFLISDPNSFSLTANIIKPEYFDSGLKNATEYILSYTDEWKTIPTPAQIKAKTGIAIDQFSDVTPQHGEWFTSEMESFCRHKALELVILDGVDLLAKGEGGEVERRVREAMTISLMKDLGTSYFEDPKTRLERLKDRSSFISTGWETLDDKLYGGFTRGALNIFAGGPGAGKSLFLLNLARNWAKMGLNVIYFSLELSEDLVSMRMDSMSTGFGTKEILKRINEVDIAVRQAGRGAGDLVFKKMPEGNTTCNDLRAYLKEYTIQTGRKVDALVIDYLDLMKPNSGKIDVANLFVKDKYTSEEMRALAHELDALCVTASQLNRQSVEAAEFDHSHIAGGISKLNTADNVMAIRTSAHMREDGRYGLEFLKTRSSSAVGSKMELAFCNASLVITDMVGGGGGPASLGKPKTATAIQSELKARTSSTIGEDDEQVDPETGEVLRAGLMDLINKNRPH
jgi:KaiC/GvpD/RAD55 family RecA-like ATPase